MLATVFGASGETVKFDDAGFTTNESSQVLLVSVHNIIYPITEHVLHQVFDPYGYVEKIDIVHSSALLQATVHFDSCQIAVRAKGQLQGRYIYEGCCQLDIQFYKSPDNDSQTRNFLRETEFAADLDFIKHELQRMIVITERMQDTVKTMISSIQKTAHTVSKSSESTSSISVISSLTNNSPSETASINISPVSTDDSETISQPSKPDLIEILDLKAATTLVDFESAQVYAGIIAHLRPQFNLKPWSLHVEMLDESWEKVRKSALGAAHNLFGKMIKPAKLSLQLAKYEPKSYTVSMFYIDGQLNCNLIFGQKNVFIFDPGGRHLKYNKTGLSQLNIILANFSEGVNQVEQNLEISLAAKTIGDEIMPLIKTFVESNIPKTEWRNHEVATFAFRSILGCLSVRTLSPFVFAGLRFLLIAINDHSFHVKNTTDWTLGRIFEIMHYSNRSLPVGYTYSELECIILSPQLSRIIVCSLPASDCTDNVSSTLCCYTTEALNGTVEVLVENMISQAPPSYHHGFMHPAEINRLRCESKVFIFNLSGTFNIESIFDLEDKVVFKGWIMIRILIQQHLKAVHGLEGLYTCLKDSWTNKCKWRNAT